MDYANKISSSPEKWVSIYPSYINSRKTIAEGRRIPKEKAVENPTCNEIHDVLGTLGLSIQLERKMYPRDANRDMTFQGRIRVQLRGENNEFLNNDFKTRKSLMFYASEMIPKLKSRVQRSGAQTSEPVATQTQKAPQKKKKTR